jgi:hypothetical protein
MAWYDGILDVLSAPAKLFTGSGPIAQAVKSVFGSETGSLTPALNQVAKAASVVDAKGNVTADSLAGGLLKAPGAILNFAEKEAVPALNFAEKTLGDLKTKVEKIPIVGKELGAAFGAVETPLKEVSGLVGGAQEALRMAQPVVSTATTGVEQARAAAAAARGAVQAARSGDISGAIEKGKQAVEAGQRTAEIGRRVGEQGRGFRSAVMAPQLPRFANRGARVAL